MASVMLVKKFEGESMEAMENTGAMESAEDTQAEETSQTNEGSESAGESQKQGEGQKAGKDQKAANAKQVRELGEQDFDSIVTVKINGEIQKLPLREVIKLNQLENVSRAKMDEAAKLMKQVQAVVNAAKNDPKKFLKDTGIDPYEFAEATLAEKFEMMNLTPEQKKLMEYEQKLKTYEEKEKSEKEAQEKEQMTKLEAEESQRIDMEIAEALKEPGLPKSRKTIADIAFKLLSSSKQGKPLTAKEAAASVKQEFIASTQEMFLQMDAEAIQEALGKDVLKKIREYDVKRVTGKAASPSSDKGLGAKPTSRPSKQFKSDHEWRAELAKMMENLKD